MLPYKMSKLLKYLCFVVVITLLSGCYPLRRVGLLQERDGLPTYDQTSEYKLYHLRQNDEVDLRIITSNEETSLLFQNTVNVTVNLTYSGFPYRIFEDGTIDIPFVNKVKIEGLTIEEAEDKIEESLSQFVDDISVKLSLSTNTFSVIGDAGRGYFPIYKERLTIYQALALCGGINESADFSKVKILRTTDEGVSIVEFDIRTKSIIDSEYYYIYPNDIIYLDISKRKFWAIGSYSTFVGVISSSLSLVISVWNTIF